MANDDSRAVVLKTEVVEARIAPSAALEREARRWSYVLRNRFRWITDEDRRKRQDEQSLETLKAIGIDKAVVGQIAGSRLLRVVFDRQAVAVPGAVEFPWEYVLSAATRTARAGRAFAVVRQLADGNDVPPRPSTNATALIVESAPGPLRRQFSFEAESSLVEAALSRSRNGPGSLARISPNSLADPTRDRLGQVVRELAPSVLHFAGVDSHQGRRLLKMAVEGDTPDGVILSDSSGGPVIEPAAAFAELLTAAAVHPRLVVMNIYNSGQTLARLVVERGALAALGFFDEVDDSAAEWLVAKFYEQWTANGGNAPEAMADVLAELHGRGAHLEGTGVVLWTRAANRDDPELELKEAPSSHQRHAASASKPGRKAAISLNDAIIIVDVRVCPGLNYALLRNNKDLFLTFRLRNLSGAPIGGIRVEVTLRAGSESYPFQGMFTIDEPVRELRDRIRVPLPSMAGLGMRENTQAVLHTRVLAKNDMIYEATDFVTLQSIEEWQLDEQSLPWLPAFVFPRDQAIEKILDIANRYVRVITEDSSYGFPGYQRAGLQLAESVDAQVSAIWAAIAYDIEPTYVGPLPGGGLRSQRLRAPRDTVANRRGTCVDLALLFASCLEYVELYPVIFLQPGHAYAGYWRDPDAYGRFCHAEFLDGLAVDRHMPVSLTAWAAGRASMGEVRRYIAEDSLVPVETLWLSRRQSLQAARAEARKSIRDISDIVDITLARAQGVSSLPLLP